MSISPGALPLVRFFAPKPPRVREGTQFSWGRLSSRVSSMETIFICGGMNSSVALRVVVLPDAVPPQTIIDWPASMAIHRYAIMSGLIVRNFSRSTGRERIVAEPLDREGELPRAS